MDKKGLKWQRVFAQPFIKPQPDTIASEAVTTPDVIEINNELYFYLGVVTASQERIILTKIPKEKFNERNEILITDEAREILLPGPNNFDCKHVFDPGVIFWKEKIWLYYSAIGEGKDKVGLATSNDGEHFEKLKNPVITGRSPEAVIKDEKVYLFYVKDLPNQGYSIFLDISEDGRNFFQCTSEPVLSIGKKDEWDNHEVTTPRIFQYENKYYMIYAGLKTTNQKDIPKAFGLARSEDLIHWEKYPRNPIFGIGNEGEWDDGAIWFGTPFLINGMIYIVYEGGRLINIIDKAPALTEVGLAVLSLDIFKRGLFTW